MECKSVYKGKEYSFGEISSKCTEVLMLTEGPAQDYSLFKNGDRFGFFRNGGFEMGYSPKSAFSIGEYFGYTGAYIYDLQREFSEGCDRDYLFSDQCYLALESKGMWTVFAFDVMGLNSPDELPGLTVMVENAGSAQDAVDKLSQRIGVHIGNWYNFSTRAYSGLNSQLGEEEYPEYIPEFAEPSPEQIDKLENNQIFVFGSNLAGRHDGGAARYALDRFGAIWGQGVGLQGQSYAIPTMQGPVEAVRPYVEQFLEFVVAHPELDFLVTRIGCGFAGFTDQDMAPLFKGARGVPNVHLPQSFIDGIEG